MFLAVLGEFPKVKVMTVKVMPVKSYVNPQERLSGETCPRQAVRILAILLTFKNQLCYRPDSSVSYETG